MSSSAAVAQTPSILPPKPQIVGRQLQAPNQMMQMLSVWGFMSTACQENVAEVRHSVTGEKACVQPNGEIEIGKFVYDSASNQIRPDEPTTLEANQENSWQTNPVPQAEDPRIADMVFTFNNRYDYSTCIDAILLIYEGRDSDLQRMEGNECTQKVTDLFGTQLSEALALQLIDIANFRATKLLKLSLYPSLGLRQRVAMRLGYIYDVDKNNSEVLKLVTSTWQ